MSRAARNGVIVKSGGVLERLASAVLELTEPVCDLWA